MSLEQILEFIQNQNEFIIYGIIVAGSFIENIFPPFPGDSVTIAGAIVAGFGNTSYIGVLVSATIGGLSGAMFLYYLGRIKGRRYFRNSRYFGESSLTRVESLFAKFGDLIIIFSRFVVGIRSAIAVAAGIGDVHPLRMTLLTIISFMIWNGILLGLVFYTKANWRMITEIGRKYNYILFAIIIAVTLILLARWIWKRKTN